ncbi:MAG: hypothetical protein MZV64_01735 [Ignavibacteriales bacterium]|nr:hypothetical protein [Ignavibacteriales bacterium]
MTHCYGRRGKGHDHPDRGHHGESFLANNSALLSLPPGCARPLRPEDLSALLHKAITNRTPGSAARHIELR